MRSVGMRAAFIIIALFSFSQALPNFFFLDNFIKYLEEKGKHYFSEGEFAYRFGIFLDNLKHVDISKGFDGLSPFMDLTEEEFMKFTGLNPKKQNGEEKPKNLRSEATHTGRISLMAESIPDTWDWRSLNVISPVKYQGSCGSCWAFSANGAIEAHHAIKYNEILDLSEQQLVDCDEGYGDKGCEGGYMTNTYSYIKDYGVTLTKHYPYESTDGEKKTCRYSKEKVVISVDCFHEYGTDEEEMKIALYTKGPLAVGINARTMHFYRKHEILKADPVSCIPTEQNHAILLVGYGEENGKKYWIAKNSWGKSFGDQGYLKIEFGTGACGVNTLVSQPQSKKIR